MTSKVWWIALWLAGCGAAGSSGSGPPLEVTIEDLGDGSDRVPSGEVLEDGATEEEEIEEEAVEEETEEQRLVRASVRARRQGDHGQLPPIERRDELAAEAWPLVTVVNDTPHRLVVWFAGPCPRTVALEPRGEHAAELCAGLYEIAAELGADDFLPFVGDGDELEDGYGYSLTFYVVAEPGRRRVRQRR